MNEIQTIHGDRKMAPLTQWLRSDTGGQKIVQWRLEKADWKQEQDLKYFYSKKRSSKNEDEMNRVLDLKRKQTQQHKTLGKTMMGDLQIEGKWFYTKIRIIRKWYSCS